MLGNLPPRDALLAFASERESIRRRKEAGEPWPYTSDPTLNRFSFTNVRREDDKTTRHCAALVRNRYKHHESLLAAITTYRWFNRIETGASLFTPCSNDVSRFDWAVTLSQTSRPGEAAKEIWEAVARKPPPHTTGAFYVPSPKDAPGLSKGEGISLLVGRFLDTSGWRKKWLHWCRPDFTPTLQEVHTWLMGAQNIGTFGAGQIIADLRYVAPLCNAPDIDTWAAMGPGSERGLNLVLGRAEKARWTPAEWRRELRALASEVWPRLEAGGVPPLHLQDFQNIVCETAKLICHDRWGRGIKQSYKPPREAVPRSDADLIARLEMLDRDASARFAAMGVDMPDAVPLAAE
jgi:alpha-glutamyl/putrescinyl thymine pyrophosphorylase clade 1